MKGSTALVLMSLVFVSNVYVTDEKNKKERQRFVKTIANLAFAEGLFLLLSNDKKDFIKDCNEISEKSNPILNYSKKAMQLPFKPTCLDNNYTGLRFVSGTPYTTVVYKKIPSKL